MSSAVDNNAFELDITPSKKRKRNSDAQFDVGFTNLALNLQSTPKNPIIQKRNNFRSNKENFGYNPDVCMETKSLADCISGNPYEVSRKPPKKKIKKQEIEENCFVNAAMNLNGPEKQPVNPYEVRRTEEIIKPNLCFVNPGLNLKINENRESNYNPFEVVRERNDCGLENPSLDYPAIAIALPFTPSLGRRIDFTNMALDGMTPSEMMARTLKINSDTPKRTVQRKSLSIISEEPIDIEEELNCYQLELENSINEAKMRKKKGLNMMDLKHISNLSNIRFKNEIIEARIEESIIEEEYEKTEEISIKPDGTFVVNTTTTKDETEIVEQIVTKNEDLEILSDEDKNEDVLYEEIEDESTDFKAPAPFKRTYRRSIRFNKPKSQEDLNAAIETNDSNKIVNSIRKSFRKLIPNKNHENEKKELSKEEEKSHGLMSTIRQSFRRKKIPEVCLPTVDHNVSIINDDVRMIFKATTTTTKEVKTEDFGRRVTLRSSFRKSTRNVMKSVFKKNVENYDMN